MRESVHAASCMSEEFDNFLQWVFFSLPLHESWPHLYAKLGHWLAFCTIDHTPRRCQCIHSGQRMTVFRGKDQLKRQLAICGKGL